MQEREIELNNPTSSQKLMYFILYIIKLYKDVIKWNI